MKKITSGFFDNEIKVLFTLGLAVLILYAKSLNFDFTTLDEQWMIVKGAPYLQKGEAFKEAFTKSLAGLYYRPMFAVSLLIDFKLGGLLPFMYHLTNVCWHLLAVILLYRFFVLLKTSKKNAFLFSLLFACHPLLIHAVAWVPGRNDIMLTVFSLASLNTLIKFLERHSFKYSFLHMLFFVCALFTKETAISLPIVFITMTFLLYRPDLKKVLYLLTPWIIISLVWLWIRNGVVTVPSQSYTIGYFSNFVLGFLIYMGKTIIPIQQSVLPTLKNSLLWPGILTLGILAIILFKPGLNDKRKGFIGLLIFFITLLVPLWFTASKGNGDLYEHRIYLPLTGLILFFTQLKINFETKYFTYVVSVLLLVFFIRSFSRMNIYMDKYHFLAAGVKEAPDFFIFLQQQADLLFTKKEYNHAVELYDKAIVMRPDLATLYNGRASSYYYLGKYDEAIRDYTKAIGLIGFNENFHLSRCLAYYRNNDIKNAMKDLYLLKKCCNAIIPINAEQQITQKWISMVEKLETRIQTEPTNANLHYEAAILYSDISMREDALNHAKKAFELDSENKEYRKLYVKYME
jgi:protein O-mannosyl-transferase